MAKYLLLAGLGFAAGLYGIISLQEWRAYQAKERQRIIDNAWWNRPAPTYN